MNARSLRRLAGDHASLHTSPLPPNYLFPPSQSDEDSSDLTVLDIYLAGPTNTPYEAGAFKLHLNIPETYPTEPPKAYFRTKIFHPNVDDATGAVCLETLKRDWDPKLTLRDILITINCLLLQPNPSSALNAEAGMLLEQGDDGWTAFERRAKFMTKLHAGVPKEWKEAVREAQTRGEDPTPESPRPETFRQDSGIDVASRRRGKRRRADMHTPLLQRADSEEAEEPSKSPPREKRPFVVHSRSSDVFGYRIPPPTTPPADLNNQENTLTTPPSRPAPPILASPARRDAPAVPLGELHISDSSLEIDSDEIEPEYPPSPRKSPRKPRFVEQENTVTASSSGTAQSRSHTNLFTPQAQTDDTSFSVFSVRRPLRTGRRRAEGQDSFYAPRAAGVAKKPAAVSPGRKSAEERRKERLERRLWDECGGDVERWNQGDFGGCMGIAVPRW